VLAGKLDCRNAPRVLREERRKAFSRKWQFNRALRRLVASPVGVVGAAAAARVFPSVFESMIRYAGDVRQH
jgi:hypothetical protein